MVEETVYANLVTAEALSSGTADGESNSCFPRPFTQHTEYPAGEIQGSSLISSCIGNA